MPLFETYKSFGFGNEEKKGLSRFFKSFLKNVVVEVLRFFNFFRGIFLEKKLKS